MSPLVCGVCVPISRQGQPVFAVRLPLDIDLWAVNSFQGRRELRLAIRRELLARPRSDPYWGTLCLSVVSVVPRASRAKNVGDFIPRLIGSMQGLFYVRTGQVQCLTSRRIEYVGPTSHCLVRAQGVRAWEPADDMAGSRRPQHAPIGFDPAG